MLQIPESEIAELRKRVVAALKARFPQFDDATLNEIFDIHNNTVFEYYNELRK